MSIYLEITDGKYVAQTVALDEGDVARVGRNANSEVFLPDDFALAENHFLLAFDGFCGRLIDSGSAGGTFLNGEKVLTAEIEESCRIRAGETEFVVLLEDEIGRLEIETPITGLVGYLKKQKQALFGLVDAARDDKALKLLKSSGCHFESLYQDESQRQLEQVAPYLVRFGDDFVFLEKFLRHGWGMRWVSFFTSDASLLDLRKHFRKFVFVKDESGEVMYFRFYDPSILRTFLPPCNEEELKSFFGPVGSFITEAETPDNFLQFAFKDGDLLTNKHKLSSKK